MGGGGANTGDSRVMEGGGESFRVWVWGLPEGLTGTIKVISRVYHVPDVLTICDDLSLWTQQPLKVAAVLIPTAQMRKVTCLSPVTKLDSMSRTRSGGSHDCCESRCWPLSPGQKHPPSQWGQLLRIHVDAALLRCHLWLYQVKGCCAAHLQPTKSHEK